MKKQMKKEEKIIDASGKTLGRIACFVAFSLMGKDKPSFERNVYSGYPVKVIGAGKIKITAKKLEGIIHKRYSGYRGGLRLMKGTEVSKKKGMSEMVRHAVYQMLPKNKLQKEMLKNLKIEE